MNRLPRLKDIARLADVSIGTVDRVMHNRGRVSKETRLKVLKIAQEIGYKPNIHASILASNKTQISLCQMIPRKGQSPYWDHAHDGIESAIAEFKSYNVKVDNLDFDLHSPDDFERQAQLIKANDYDGLLVAPIFHSEWSKLYVTLQDKNILHSLINTLPNDESKSFLCYVGPHSFQSGRLAAGLLSLHSKPGDKVLMVPLERDFHNADHMLEKEKGLRERFSEINPLVKVLTKEFEEYNNQEGLIRFLKDQIDLHPTLTAIYTSASRIHLIAKALSIMQITHIKLVGYDTIEKNMEHLNRGNIHYLINQNPRVMGYLGFNNLCKYLFFGTRPETLTFMPLDVVLAENAWYYENHYLLKSKQAIPI